MQHLVRRILDDAHIMKSAAEEALFEFVNSQKAHDRMSQDLALLGHDTSGQSAKLNEYAQLLSAYSRYADMLASRVEAALVFGAESIPRLQLEEVRGLSRR
ncbi:hypothetical protein [Sporisorium scitamineum]|nr:hypothetical protein [Sporisorium scitamineum]